MALTTQPASNMFLINNQATVDFSSYVDVSSLLDLKPYLDYAVVKSAKTATPSRYYKSQFLDKTYLGINDVVKNSYEYDFIDELKATDQFASWLRYNQDVIYGQQSLQIRYPKEWSTKHLAEQTVDTDNVQYWQPFFDWLNKQNVFEQYGRVVVFLNEPGVATPIHQDSPDPARKDEFIWISLDNRKKMFVFDGTTKHYLTTPIGTFDATNYHGAEASDLASWSLRVDGVFSKDFLDRTGLLSHYRL
jgi:hypothetical protein